MILVLVALLRQYTILSTWSRVFLIVTVRFRCGRCALELLSCLMFIGEWEVI